MNWPVVLNALLRGVSLLRVLEFKSGPNKPTFLFITALFIMY